MDKKERKAHPFTKAQRNQELVYAIDVQGRTKAQVAESLGISKARVSQLYAEEKKRQQLAAQAENKPAPTAFMGSQFAGVSHD